MSLTVPHELVAALAAEQKLLAQLIYRNHNQHSSTELFSYLKSLNRQLSMLASDKLLIALSKLEDSIKDASQSKLAQSDLGALFVTNGISCLTLHLISSAVQTCLRCGSCVRRLLAKKIFLPLYSMLLAISARIFTCLGGLHDHFYDQGSILSVQLKVRYFTFFSCKHLSQLSH